ncbi:hypothetical protein GF340_05250, partial [Candidatus Peregrinibacteria bacterium]|nr:hypothetical protein [Candidatus Peregrinibacteria bacterium]
MSKLDGRILESYVHNTPVRPFSMTDDGRMVIEQMKGREEAQRFHEKMIGLQQDSLDALVKIHGGQQFVQHRELDRERTSQIMSHLGSQMYGASRELFMSLSDDFSYAMENNMSGLGELIVAEGEKNRREAQTRHQESLNLARGTNERLDALLDWQEASLDKLTEIDEDIVDLGVVMGNFVDQFEFSMSVLIEQMGGIENAIAEAAAHIGESVEIAVQDISYTIETQGNEIRQVLRDNNARTIQAIGIAANTSSTIMTEAVSDQGARIVAKIDERGDALQRTIVNEISRGTINVVQGMTQMGSVLHANLSSANQLLAEANDLTRTEFSRKGRHHFEAGLQCLQNAVMAEDVRDALKSLRKASKIQPDSYEVKYAIGTAYAVLEELDQAFSFLRRAGDQARTRNKVFALKSYFDALDVLRKSGQIDDGYVFLEEIANYGLYQKAIIDKNLACLFEDDDLEGCRELFEIHLTAHPVLFDEFIDGQRFAKLSPEEKISFLIVFANFRNAFALN